MAQAKALFKLPDSGYKGVASTRGFEWIVDEPKNLGGTDKGPTPMELLCSSIASCIGITLQMYAARKKWILGEILVEVYTTENEHKQTQFHKKMEFSNAENLTDEQVARLHVISTNCPVSKIIQQAVPVILD